MIDFLLIIYPLIKSLHIIAVVAWMAGLFYLPRLLVYHVERSTSGDILDHTFQVMELKLMKVIMQPAMITTWIFGILLIFVPGVVDWSDSWPWVKLLSVLLMTWFHYWLRYRSRDFVNGANVVTGRQYRLMNEIPTILLIVIVFSVVLKF